MGILEATSLLAKVQVFLNLWGEFGDVLNNLPLYKGFRKKSLAFVDEKLDSF